MSQRTSPLSLLASIMCDTHGPLVKVDLVSSPKNFSLEFEDGPVIWPRKQSSREEWYQNHMDAVRRYVSAGYGGDPLNKLAFGYDGSGSSALTEFLTGAGFENINARKLEAPSQLFPSKKKRGGEVQMNGIGIVFDIDALEEANYGWKAWLIFMRNLQPGNIRGCKLQEGDTKATLSGNRNEFCIAVFGLTLDPDQIKNIFADCADKGLAPTDRRFIMPPQLDSESLVDAGVVDSSGRLVQDEWSRSFHDRCKDSGWGYAPKSVTFDLTLELKSELENLRHKAVPLVAQEAAKKCLADLENKRRKEEQKRREEEEARRIEEQKQQELENKRRKEEQKRREEEEKRQAAEETKRRVEEQRRLKIQASRKTSGQCVMCGQPLGPFQKLLRKDRHKSCNAFKD